MCLDSSTNTSNVVCFLLGNSPASEFYMPTFRNTLFHLHRQVGMKNLQTYLPMEMEQKVPKRQHIKFRAGELPRRKHTTFTKRRMFKSRKQKQYSSHTMTGSCNCNGKSSLMETELLISLWGPGFDPTPDHVEPAMVHCHWNKFFCPYVPTNAPYSVLRPSPSLNDASNWHRR
jgi:hypothetical protein